MPTKPKKPPAPRLPKGQIAIQVIRAGDMLSFPETTLDSRTRAHILAETPDGGGTLIIARFVGGQSYARGLGWVYAPARIQVIRLLEKVWRNAGGDTWTALCLMDVPVRMPKPGEAPRPPEHVSINTGGDPFKSVPAGVRRALAQHGVISKSAAGAVI